MSETIQRVFCLNLSNAGSFRQRPACATQADAGCWKSVCMAHFLQQQDANTSFQELAQTVACAAQAIVQVHSDTRCEIWKWSCMVMIYFIIAGDGDDLGWSSQKLSEKLELVQKARLGPGHDNKATVLNRCVIFGNAGLTWEADPWHAELAVAEFGLQAARPQTSPGGAKPNAPLDHEELEPDGQKAYHSVSARLSYFTAIQPDIASACKECSLKRIGPYPLNSQRGVWEFPLQSGENIVTIDGFSDADAIWWMLTRWTTYLGNLVVDTEGCAVERRRIRVPQHGTLCEWSYWASKHDTRTWTSSTHMSLDRRCSSAWTGSPQWEWYDQTHGNEVLLAVAEGGEPGAQDWKDPRHSQSRRFDYEASGWETFGNDVWAVEHQTGWWTTWFSSKNWGLTRSFSHEPPEPWQRWHWWSEHRRARSLSEAIQETWIDGHGMDWWITASWILVGIVTCCIMIILVLLRRESWRFTEIVDDETETLEEGRNDQIIPCQVLITKNGTSCEIILTSDSELVFSLRSKWHFRKKTHLESARWDMRTSFWTSEWSLNCRVFVPVPSLISWVTVADQSLMHASWPHDCDAQFECDARKAQTCISASFGLETCEVSRVSVPSVGTCAQCVARADTSESFRGVSAETRCILRTPGSIRPLTWPVGKWGRVVVVSTVESRELVLDEHLVSRDTVQSIGPTAANKKPNTQTTEEVLLGWRGCHLLWIHGRWVQEVCWSPSHGYFHRRSALRVTCVFLTFAALRINWAGVICDRVVLSKKKNIWRLCPRVPRETSWTIVHSFQLDLAKEYAVLSGGSSHHAFDRMLARHENDGMPCLHFRVHRTCVHPLMKFGKDFWWRCSLMLIFCWMWCHSKFQGVFSNFRGSMVRKDEISNFFAPNRPTRDLSGLGFVELKNGRPWTFPGMSE